MKSKIVICAGLLAVASAGPALAQGGPAYPAQAGLRPYEVVSLVRATGLEPLSRPVRHGPHFTLQAVDPAGQPVGVTVDARVGRIVGVAPSVHSRFAGPVLPSSYARPPAGFATDGYGPASRTSALTPGDGFNGPLAAPGRAATANAGDGKANAAPLPRARPSLAAAQPAPAAAVAPQPVSAAPAEIKGAAPASVPPGPAAPAVEHYE